VIDSGIDPANPYVGPIAGGVHFAGLDWIDRIGHGTVVAATIRAAAPHAELYAVRIFDRELTTQAELLLSALEWCAAQKMDIANLSLGTANRSHELALREAVERAQAAGVTIVAARQYLPGSLPGVIGVDEVADAVAVPGMPYGRGLRGVSFAVARMSGAIAARRSSHPANPDA
jgi:hypothetical protein